MTLAKTSLAAGLALIITGLTVLSVKVGWFTWAATPAGKATITAGMFVALVAVLIYLAIRTERRDRAKREAQDEADYDEWERQIREDDLSMADWRRQLRLEAEIIDAEVRRITDQERRAEADRLDQNTWPMPQSPRLTDWAYVPADPQPLPPRYWLGDPKPMAEAQSYAGAAAWFGSDMRAGVDVVVEAPVSPAPPAYRPRHDADDPRPPAHVIGYNRVAARVLNEATDSFKVVRSEKVLVGAGAS